MPTKNKLDILLWAFPSWNGDYLKSTVELAKELALRHRVLYIDYSYTWKDIFGRGNKSVMPTSYIMGRNCGLREESLSNGAKMNILSLPPIIPFNWINNSKLFSSIEKMNSGIIAPRIRHALDVLQFDTDIAINAFNPFMARAMQSIFDRYPTIYYCYDNISASRWAAKHGTRLEADFAKKADAVIYSSEALRANKHFPVPEYVVNNGVDLRNFQKHCLYSQIKNNQPKLIGYVGSIDDRLDYDILEYCIKNRPDYNFQFIGRLTTDDWKSLEGYSNVTFTGAVDPSQLPSMMANFDAGIIPFVKNDFTKNIYPMKVNEYLALGMPVVSTDFADIPDLAPYMSIGNTREAFAEMLDEEIKTNNYAKKAKRKTKAASNSWEQKAKEFEKILLHYVNAR